MLEFKLPCYDEVHLAVVIVTITYSLQVLLWFSLPHLVIIKGHSESMPRQSPYTRHIMQGVGQSEGQLYYNYKSDYRSKLQLYESDYKSDYRSGSTSLGDTSAARTETRTETRTHNTHIPASTQEGHTFIPVVVAVVAVVVVVVVVGPFHPLTALTRAVV